MATTKKKKLKPITDWRVDISFETHEIRVRARTAGEAKKKAAIRLTKKGAGLMDRRNTFAEKY